MRRSKYRRANSPAWFSGRRRIIALAAASLAAFGGVVAVTQISSASTENTARKDALAACDRLQAPANSRLSTQTRKGTYTTNNGRVTQHADDGAGDTATTAQVRTRCRDWVMKNVADTKAGSTNAGTKAGNANTGTNAGNANTGNTNAGNGAVATVNCPEVPIGVAVPASAKAEVDQNLAQLQKQIQEANARIASSQGQGGANFIQNAILNPLKDKRFAAINRMETAIGRAAAKPNLNAEGLSTCTLNAGNQGGNNNAGNQGGNNNAGNQGGNNNAGNQGGNNNAGNQGGNNNAGNQGGNNQGGNNNGGNAGGQPATPPPGAGLGILTNSCDTSQLEDHDGFQRGNRCVSTEFGEVGAAANNPTLLITNAPRQVNRNQPFTLQVSTRNLIRDRFLAAGQGGYYVESSVLQGGLVRGHFHTACRILDNRNAAPAGDPVPAFFVATEDSRGGAQPDTVAIQVPGLAQSGEFQCSAWAGDGSHRIPMMERANQTPALDSVRVTVR
jgi:hypothetical protein